MESAGQRLRTLREQLGLTIRDVEAASGKIAERRGREDFAIQISRLSDIETKGVVPSIYRLYSLAAIYRRDLSELLSWYDIDIAGTAADAAVIDRPRSHASTLLPAADAVKLPVRLDPAFDLKRTSNIGRMVQAWGLVPLVHLSSLAEEHYTYGYIGTEDFTMYPLLLPGAFIQVDETRTRIEEGGWKSEYERPVYFVEMRNAFVCCWCALKRDQLVLQPHPLSPEPVRIVKYPQEAEVVGQVVGVAMRLGQWRTLDGAATPKGPQRLN